MIRRAEREDWGKVLDLFRSCHEASNYGATFCDASALRMLELTQAGPAVCLVNDDVSGVLFLCLTPLHFNHAALSANELCLWGADGKALIEAGEAWATEQGAARLVMGCEQTEKRGRGMGRLYERFGFRAFGHTYEKRLTDGC